MQRKKPDVDVIKDVLQAALEALPASAFLQSLLQQYEERGGLSKRQLQGLWGKASKLGTISPSKLATLEAMILKMPMKFRSAAPPKAPLYTRDTATGNLIDAILEKYPGHKRVLYFKNKFDRYESLTPLEADELKRFHTLLVSRDGRSPRN